MFLKSFSLYSREIIKFVNVILIFQFFHFLVAFKIYRNIAPNFKINGLNICVGELDPPTLSPIEKLISPELERDLKSKGFFSGQTTSWRNWHILSQGQWKDIGKVKLNVESNPKFYSPYAIRKPLQYWGETRAVDTNLKNYAGLIEMYREYWPDGYKPKDGGAHLAFNPNLFMPEWIPWRDRDGLQYADVRFFHGWAALPPGTPVKVKSASPIVVIPNTGRRYQKFYLGPYPDTFGWTIGSLMKAMAIARSPGHAVVAIKIHNMNKDTTIDKVREDLLHIGLYAKNIAFETITPGVESRVRSVIKGPVNLCAGALDWPKSVKLATPEVHIAHIEEGGELDIEFKIEWGRGSYLGDMEGLIRTMDGCSLPCSVRRRVKEVEEGFYPIDCVFGGCRMVRISVHKLLGNRWCADSQICPDPKEQLVFEIWTDESTTPLSVLEFSLIEIDSWMKELIRQVSSDVDFDMEDEQLKDSWVKIDKFGSLMRKIELMGGPKIKMLHETNLFNTNNPEDFGYTERDIKEVREMRQAPINVPLIEPTKPDLDPVVWLSDELSKEDYAESVELKAGDLRKPEIKPSTNPAENHISSIPLSYTDVKALEECGIETFIDAIRFREFEIRLIPNLSEQGAKMLIDYCKTLEMEQ